MKKISMKLFARISLIRLNLLAVGIILAVVNAGFAQSSLQFTSAIYGVNEAAGAVSLAVLRTNDTSSVVSVDYATADGTATNGLKYIAANGTLTFAAGDTNQIIVVPILNNGLADGTKTFQVTLSNPTGGAVLGGRATTTILIADNDEGIDFRFASYSVAEDAGAVVIGMVRGDDGTLPVTVDLATTDLTATNGLDYLGITNTLAFGPTEHLKFFSVPILNNRLKQPNRTFRVTLSNPTGGTLGSTKTTTVTITDNDQGFQFELASCSVPEDAGAALISVLRGSAENSPATVDYATADGTATKGLDYTGRTNTLSFAPGERVKLVPVPILNDGLKEGSKNFRVTLSNPTGGTGLGARTNVTVTIQDNDPGLGFELSSYSVCEKERAGAITLTVVRGNDGALGTITVDYATSDLSATAGNDYQAASGKLEFQENETVKSLTVPILRPTPTGTTKSFRVTLTNPTGGATLATAITTVNILEDYPKLTPPADARLTIRPEGGVNLLTWTGGAQLQRADRVTGPWQTLTAARSPLPVRSPLAVSFYQVKHPRPATLFIPSSYDGQTPMPLVILLHGGGWSGQQVENYMQFTPVAQARGFLYCYPDGHINLHGDQCWTSTSDASDPPEWGTSALDDAGYLRGLIEEVGRHFVLDRKRVFLIGHSNGGHMCFRMACECADLVAGIASLGSVTFFDPSMYAPSEPVNILDIHSLADQSCSYWGGALTIPRGFFFNTTPYPGAVRTVQIWAGYNGAHDPVTDPAPSLDLVLDVAGLDTVITRYTSAPPGGAVELWTISGAPHRPAFSSEFSPRVIDWLLAHPKP